MVFHCINNKTGGIAKKKKRGPEMSLTTTNVPPAVPQTSTHSKNKTHSINILPDEIFRKDKNSLGRAGFCNETILLSGSFVLGEKKRKG